MLMKTRIFSLLLYFLLVHTGIGFTQNLPIEPTLNKYFSATQAKDWGTVMDLINPRLFNFAPKDMLIQLYSQMENHSGMGMEFTEIEVLDIKKEWVHADTSYVPVDYRMTMELQLHPALYQDPKTVNNLMQGLEISYQGQEVIYDEENMRFTIRVKNTLIASSRQNANQWFLGEYRPSDPVTQLIFPVEILNKLKNGWD